MDGENVSIVWCQPLVLLQVVGTGREPISVALLPYVQTTFGRLIRMLAKHNIKCGGLPLRKIASLLCPMKDDVGLSIPGVYSIPCECGPAYIG